MYCISINYKTADIDIRRRLAFSPDEQAALTSEILSGTARQCVLLCTCNRTEVYFDGQNAEEALKPLSERGGFSEGELSPHVMIFADDGAVRHLFKTAAGLDSMVIGEDEILRQIKEAYALSKKLGAVGAEFNIIFQAAFSCAKEIKTATPISKTPLSVATLAAKEAAASGEDTNVLVIGATGKTGISVIKNLAAYKNVRIFAALRRKDSEEQGLEARRAKLLAELGTRFRPAKEPVFIDYADRYKALGECGCVISATSGPHYTITAREARKYPKPRLYIDLAVPPDIERSVAETEGARLIGIDEFKRIARRNNALRTDCAQTAEEMIERRTDDLKKELYFREFLPQMNGLKDMSAEKLLFTLKSKLDPSAFSKVLDALREEDG